MEHPYRPFDEDTDYIAAGAQKSSQNAKNMTSSTITAVSQTDNNPQDLTLAFGDHSTATSTIGNKVRLRAIESESEYFLKLMNVTVLRWFALIQAIATGIIFLSQVKQEKKVSLLRKTTMQQDFFYSTGAFIRLCNKELLQAGGFHRYALHPLCVSYKYVSR